MGSTAELETEEARSGEPTTELCRVSGGLASTCASGHARQRGGFLLPGGLRGRPSRRSWPVSFIRSTPYPACRCADDECGKGVAVLRENRRADDARVRDDLAIVDGIASTAHCASAASPSRSGWARRRSASSSAGRCAAIARAAELWSSGSSAPTGAAILSACRLSTTSRTRSRASSMARRAWRSPRLVAKALHPGPKCRSERVGGRTARESRRVGAIRQRPSAVLSSQRAAWSVTARRCAALLSKRGDAGELAHAEGLAFGEARRGGRRCGRIDLLDR